MKKIISSLLGIALTLSIIGGVAYAAFTDTAAVEGISFTAANAELSVWDGDSYEDIFTSSWNFAGVMPGFTDSTRNFWLKNESDAGITFDVAGKLRDGVDGDWDTWKDVVEVAIVPTGDVVAEDSSDWHTLNTWNSPGFSIDSELLAGEEEQYTFHVRVDESATSILEGSTLTSVEFDFTGTQVTE